MKNIILLSFLLFTTVLKAQNNLVSNPSFELINLCPYQIDTMICSSWDTTAQPPYCIYYHSESWCFDSVLIGWKSFGGTPNYYNSCAAPGTKCGIPNNFVVHAPKTQFAIDGNGYAGIATIGFWPLTGEVREYIGTPLNTNLTPGATYYVSAYVIRTATHSNNANVGGASNNLGFRFTTVPYTQHDSIPIDNFAHVVDTNLITDTLNWTRISGSFVADSAYQYVAFGNFFDDAHTDTFNVYLGQLDYNYTYYLVDQVCVSSDSTTCELVNSVKAIENTAVKVYPNPFEGYIRFEYSSEAEVILYDHLQREVIRKRFKGAIDLNTEGLAKGLYFYNLIGNEKTYKGILAH
jgi:hypothetical protein